MSRIVSAERVALTTDFMSPRLGFGHIISRECVINEYTTTFGKKFFFDWIDGTVLIVLDGTYVFIEKC